MNKTYIGSVLIKWKEAFYASEKSDGTIKAVGYAEDLRSWGNEKLTITVSGTLIGEIKWIKFGDPDSKYD